MQRRGRRNDARERTVGAHPETGSNLMPGLCKIERLHRKIERPYRQAGGWRQAGGTLEAGLGQLEEAGGKGSRLEAAWKQAGDRRQAAGGPQDPEVDTGPSTLEWP